ncbi:MAG: radical SAM protein [Elusimicrobiota bacterium]
MPDISLWNKCNNKCIMCTNPKEYSTSTPSGNYDLKTQVKKLKLYIEKGEKVYFSNHNKKNYINITGGEPTLHPDFFKFLVYLREKLPDIPITLLTNGRKFSNVEFTKRFASLAKNPFTTAISFYTCNEKNFERISKVKGSYKQTLSGIVNLAKYFSGTIEIRVVIHRLNIDDLPQTITFIKNILIACDFYITIIHYEIEGIAEINKNKLFLSLSDSAKKISEIEDMFLDGFIRLYHFPLCVLSENLRKYAWITLPKEERIYTSKCYKCKIKRKCLGLMKRYYELYGDYELKPILK